MKMWRLVKRIGKAVVGPAFAIVAILYFGLNLVQGDRGFLAWMRLGREVRAAEAALAQTEAERLRLEHRASLLKGDHLDPDMLDERARAALNTIGPNESVIFLPAENH